MNRSPILLLSVFLFLFPFLFLVLGPFANARETTINQASLPAAVRDSLRSRYPGATISRFTRDVEKGAVVYEAEMTIQSRSVDALFDAHGRLREEEAQIPVSDLPKAVRKAVERISGRSGSIERAERLTSGATHRLRFEVLVVQGGARSEYLYSPSGRLLKIRRSDGTD